MGALSTQLRKLFSDSKEFNSDLTFGKQTVYQEREIIPNNFSLISIEEKFAVEFNIDLTLNRPEKGS
ncbi:hypothetical protein [Cylindrospermum stagnale]|nr:hypothetical protein [Cylindrospermum stagnale]